VRDNLAVALPDAGDDRYLAALDRADLPRSFLDRVGDELSGGEAQRACLARTLVTEPRVLLMDEVTSSLDPTSTSVLERLAMQLAASGVPVLWVTHDLAQMRRIADHEVVLTHGRLATDDETAAFLAGSSDEPTVESSPAPVDGDLA
jgi:putative ABC transport system ATP-binding protein